MTTRRLTYFALFIALSAVLANVKFMGSIALDSLPAFFAAVFMGPIAGGFIGLLGHLISAMLSGFPLTWPIHTVIAALMFISVYIFGRIYPHVNQAISFIVGVFFNAVLSTFISVWVMGLMNGTGFNMALVKMLMPTLLIASSISVALAVMLIELLRRRGYEKL